MILNDTKLLERIGFKPHEGQLAVLEAAKSKEVREIALSAGRRFGKSLLCAYLVLREVLKPNKKIWIVSVNYDLTQKVFSYLLQFISKIFDPKVIKGHSRP
jgi:phage terminase large subunit-like protein